jgi:hypothetical protein
MSYLITGCNDFDFQNVILLDFCYISPDKNILPDSNRKTM